jgi:hypothetical protein
MPGMGGCLQSGFTETRLPECKDSQGNILDPASLDPRLYSQAQIDAVLANVSPDSPPCWYLSYDTSPLGCAQVFKGQRISALRKMGTVAPVGTFLAMQCLTCAITDEICPPLGVGVYP